MNTLKKAWVTVLSGGGIPLQNVSAPVIQGAAREESILYVTDGQWKDNPNAISYQWKRDGVNISGATNGAYTLTAADVGTQISCDVTMQNTYLGYSKTATAVLETTIVQSYAKDILDLNPIALWRLNEITGTTADNFEGTAARDGVISANLLLDTCFFKDGSKAIKSPTSTGNFNINVYSASLNSAFNKNVGAISFWLRPDSVAQWSSTGSGANPYAFQFEIDASNRFRMITLNNGSWRIGRRSAGTNKDVDIDMSSNPSGWQNFIMTWDTGADQLKVYLNGVQQGSTLTGLSSIAGALTSTKCCLLAGDTSNTGPLQGWRMENFTILDFVPTAGQITTLSTAPQGKWWTPTTETFDLEAIFPSITQGAPVNSFLYDVDNDGELELVGEIGARPFFAAVKSDGTIVWQNNISETQADACRTPCIRSGVMYFGHKDDAVRAIRLSDGQVLWTSSGDYDMITTSTEGLVCVKGTTCDILSYATGVSIGGNFPVTLPFTANLTQTLSAGTFNGETRDSICIGQQPSGGRMICLNYDGTTRWERDDFQNHIDRFEFFDADGDGNVEVVCVLDTDNSTGGASEGNELVLLDKDDGSVKDTFTAPSTGVSFCCTEKLGNGIKIVYGIESFSGSAKLGALNSTLDEVFTAYNVSSGGSLVGAMRAMGTWIMMTNKDLETNPDQVFIDENGNPVRFFTGSGFDWTNVIDAEGGFNVRVEQGKQVGNHRDFFYILSRKQRGGTAITEYNYFWHKFELGDIP